MVVRDNEKEILHKEKNDWLKNLVYICMTITKNVHIFKHIQEN